MTDHSREPADIGGTDVERLLEQVEAHTPAPGGGSAASVAGALGASLLHMTASFSFDTDSDEQDVQQQRLKEIRQCSRKMLELAEKDRRAYENYQKLQQGNGSEQDRQEALVRSTKIPLEMSACCERLMNVFLDLRDQLKPSFQADVKTALQLIRVNWNSAVDLATYNLNELSEGQKKVSLRATLSKREKRMDGLFERVEQLT